MKIIEQLPEELKQRMEDVLSDIEQFGDGYQCAKDSADALNLLRENNFFTSGDQVVGIEGPVVHYNHKLNKYTRDKHHFVGQINEKWIIDVACEPGGRVFYNMNDYIERSGIKLPNK